MMCYKVWMYPRAYKASEGAEDLRTQGRNDC